MTALQIGLMVGGLAAIYVLTRTVAALVAPGPRFPAHIRRQRRREMLLTFSPLEWIWLIGSMTVMAVLLLRSLA